MAGHNSGTSSGAIGGLSASAFDHTHALSSRRSFLKRSTAAVAGATLATAIGKTARARPAPSDTLRVGLVGCGNRGGGAILDALWADKNAVLVAVGDAFADQAERLLKKLKQTQWQSQVKVGKKQIFTGFDAYKQVIDSVEVVLLATPPHFRPEHLTYAIAQGRHVFAEKPVAVDPPGVHQVLAACREAKKKSLCVVSGLCFRYSNAMQATFKKIHDGAIGRIVALQTSYNTNGLWHKRRLPDWSDMEYQLRNWLYYTWLSGDFICEQHVHSLDKMAWAMRDEYPVKVSATGGRQVRTDPKYGHVYDHFSSVFTYKSGAKLFSRCRQQDDCTVDVTDYVMGSLGTADIMQHKIGGQNEWRYHGKPFNMYRVEHGDLFRAIRAGEPINNGDYMAKSTMMAVMARMSAYTGKDVSWKEAMASDLRLGPEKYEWGTMPTPAVAIPGAG